MNVTHLSLGVSDIAATERFYRDELGLPITRKSDDLIMKRDGFILVFYPSKSVPPAEFHFGFAVESRAAIAGWAERLGNRIVHREPDGRAIRVRDPDGYVIEFYDPAAV